MNLNETPMTRQHWSEIHKHLGRHLMGQELPGIEAVFCPAEVKAEERE